MKFQNKYCCYTCKTGGMAGMTIAGIKIAGKMSAGIKIAGKMPAGIKLAEMRIALSNRRVIAATIFGVVMCSLIARGQEAPKEPPKEDYVKSHYTKYEYRIPMRDGKRLFTSVYVPKDTSQSYPILMDRTPYNV